MRSIGYVMCSPALLSTAVAVEVRLITYGSSRKPERQGRGLNACEATVVRGRLRSRIAHRLLHDRAPGGEPLGSAFAKSGHEGDQFWLKE